MALRSVWRGVIRFGMVVIPVNLYSAIEEKTVHFHLVHGECGSRVQQPRYCPKCQRMISPEEEIKRSYEIAKDQEIILEETDFASLPLKTLHTIDIQEFALASQIDPIRYHGSYFLGPEELGKKPYFLLSQAMEKTGLVAIAKLTFRNKEHLSAIRPYQGILILHPLYYEDELRSPKELWPGKITFSDRELSLAIELINSLKTKRLNLKKYRDDYRQALLKIIEAKLSQRPVLPLKVEMPEFVDLAAALMASLSQGRKNRQRRIKR